MYLRSLHLQQFRNYEDAYFEFVPGLNLICGPNAQGKTSLLEAIHYLMIGRSFRSSQHQDVIKIGTPSFYLEALFCKHTIDQKLRFYISSKERKIFYNSTALPNLANLLGILQGVVMTPDDVQLVKGAPALRRQFLDIQIAQVDPLYVHHLTRYAKAMRQRNQLLKQRKTATLEVWEHEMAQAAAYIVKCRRHTIQALQEPCQTFYAYLTQETEHLSLDYRHGASSCQNEQEIRTFYLHQFHKQRDRELLLGQTLSGPHKDDVWVGIGGRDVRYFASEGQQRSCVIALHVGEWQSLKQATEDIPLFMVDDVGISLDEKRREKLMKQLASLGQVFLTTTDCHLLDAFQGTKKVFILP
jgi:DNA replication and repair protein RecF